MRELTDIVKDFQNGNQDAFMELISSLYISNIIQSIYSSKHNYNKITKSKYLEKDEIVSECYILLERRLKNFEVNTSKQITAYLNIVLRGHMIELIEKEYKIANNEFQMFDSDEISLEDICRYDYTEDDIVDRIDSAKSNVLIQEIFKEFPFLEARYVREMTYDQIAKHMECSKRQAWKKVKEEQEEAAYYLSKHKEQEYR